nr:threonine synthase [Candidatus Sigynarchaeota archaeon]
MEKYTITCLSCGGHWSDDVSYLQCPKCNGQLDARLNLGALKEKCSSPGEFLNMQGPLPRGMWLYFDFLPLKSAKNIVTLGEGATPLVRCKNLSTKTGLKHLSIKVETGNPTGSFKDRQVSMGISKAIEMGAPGVITVSSGNVGAAVSAYSARARLPAMIFVPEISTANKVSQIQMYGARVFKVASKMTSKIQEVVNPFCIKHGFTNLMTASPVNPYINHGAKTIAYEIARDCIEKPGMQLPGVIVCPAGGGGLLAYVYRGFVDLLDLGIIDAIPRFVAVQPAGCPPLAKAILEDIAIDRVLQTPWMNINTIASALADDVPLDARLAIPAVKNSKGTACIVDDAAILAGEKKLAQLEGIFAEPSSAITVAALEQLVEKRFVDKSEHVVLLVTGSGFKDMSACQRINPELITIPMEHDWDSEFSKIMQKTK